MWAEALVSATINRILQSFEGEIFLGQNESEFVC